MKKVKVPVIVIGIIVLLIITLSIIIFKQKGDNIDLSSNESITPSESITPESTLEANIAFKNRLFEDYDYYIKRFAPEKTTGKDILLGEIKDEKAAREAAEEIWSEKYPDDTNVLDPEKHTVIFDETKQVWLVVGKIKEFPKGTYYLGGLPFIIIEKESGKVLAIWHTA